MAQVREESRLLVLSKEGELQAEMEHLMTIQSQQMSRLFAVIKDKNEVELLSGVLLKRTTKGVIRWHKRYVRLTTKHLVCWSDPRRNSKCRFIDLREVREIHVTRGDRGEASRRDEGKAGGADRSFEVRTTARSFFFQAQNEAEMREWMQRLDQAINTTEYVKA